MKIGIDARLISQTGVGVYIRNLLSNLDGIVPATTEFVIYLKKQDFDQVSFKSSQFKKVAADFQWHSIAEQTGFLKMLETDKLDLMHFTYLSYPVQYKQKFVTTIHDLTHLHYKSGKASTKNPLTYGVKHAALTFVLKKQVENAATIITPSQAVKSDIEKTFGSGYGKKINVIYEGFNSELLNSHENVSLKTRFPKPFFLYVGNFYPHKNVERLLNAFSQVNTDEQLILVGPNDHFVKSIQNSIEKLQMTAKVIYFGPATNEELVFFYKHARAFIHPSLSEGFGLPLIEASYFDCPVIASNIEIFKEILDNRFLAFDPESVYDMANKITLFAQSKSDIKLPDKDALFAKFSFSNMAKQTLDIYNKVV